MSSTPLLVPVLPHTRVYGWPLHGEGARVTYVPLAEALTQSWPTDAHTAAYSVPAVERRLTLDLLDADHGHALSMVLALLDLDDPDAHAAHVPATEAWWTDQRQHIDALLTDHPGGYAYRTRGGARVLYRLPEPVVLRTRDDAETWRETYRAWCAYVRRRYAIVADVACADAVRLYRLPRATRDAGGTPEDREAIGDPQAAGVWDPALSAEDWAATRPATHGTADAPASIPAHLPPEDICIRRARAYLAVMPPAVSGEHGHLVLYRAALSLVRGFALPEAAAYALLAADYSPQCSPPWSETDLRRKVSEAARASRVSLGYLLAEDHVPTSPPHSSATSPDDPARAGAPALWPDPVPLGDSTPAPSFPVAALPAWIAEWVAAEAVATQTPPDLAGTLALACAASAVAGRWDVRVAAGWSEPLCLYGTVVLPSGERKSAVYRHATRPIRDRERELAAEAAPRIAEAAAARRAAALRLRTAEKHAAHAAEEDRAAAEAALADAARALAEMPEPAMPRLLVDDITPEALGRTLGEQGGRLALMSAEGGVWDIVAGLYHDGVPVLDVLLHAHCGEEVRVDRVGRPSVYVPHATLTLALAVQPEVLRGMAAQRGFRGRGLIARVLYAVPRSLVGYRATDAPPMAAGVVTAYRGGMRALLLLPDREGEDGRRVTRHLTLSPEAREVLRELERDVELRMRPDGDLAGARDWTAKLAGATARIAGVLHLAHLVPASGEPADGDAIPAETMERAVAVGRYYLAHARVALDLMGADPALEHARQLLARLTRARAREVTRRDAYRALRGRVGRVADVDPVLSLLADHGYLRPVDAPARSGAGRRPSERYEVHPSLAAGETLPPATAPEAAAAEEEVVL